MSEMGVKKALELPATAVCEHKCGPFKLNDLKLIDTALQKSSLAVT
jgi:hypothetical protein